MSGPIHSRNACARKRALSGARCRTMLAPSIAPCAIASDGARCRPTVKSRPKSTSTRVTGAVCARARTISETTMPGMVVDEPGPATITPRRSEAARVDEPSEPSGRRNTVPPKPLSQDHAQAPKPVAQRVEVAAAVDSVGLEARDLCGLQPGPMRANVDEQLHLEAVRVD